MAREWKVLFCQSFPIQHFCTFAVCQGKASKLFLLKRRKEGCATLFKTLHKNSIAAIMTHSDCFFLVGGATPHSGPASSTLAVWTGQIIKTHWEKKKKKKKVVNRTWTSHNSGLKQEWCGLGASAARIMRRLLTHGSGAAAICRTVGCLFRRCKTPPSISTRRAENRAGCPKVICQRQTRRLKRGGAQSLSQPPVQIFYRRCTEPGPSFEHRNKEFSRLWNVFFPALKKW